MACGATLVFKQSASALNGMAGWFKVLGAVGKERARGGVVC